MSFQPLQLDEKRRILEVLNEAARNIFVGLDVPLETVSRAALHCNDTELPLEQLPTEVRERFVKHWAAWQNLHEGEEVLKEDWKRRNTIANMLMRHLNGYNNHPQVMERWLLEKIGPALEEVSRIDHTCFRTLWRRLVRSYGDPPPYVDLFLNLARAFSEDENGEKAARFAEMVVFKDNTCSWQNLLPPSESFAVLQVLELGASTGSLTDEVILSWAIRIGNFGLVERILKRLAACDTRDITGLIRRFNGLVRHMEGLIFYLNDHLHAYLDALEQQERLYWGDDQQDREAKKFPLPLVAGQDRPTLEDLGVAAASMVHRKDVNEDLLFDKFSIRLEVLSGVAVWYLYVRRETYAAIPILLTAMFYCEAPVFHLHGKRVLEQTDRWIAYWVCYGHRYAVRQPNHDPDEVDAYRLLRMVVTIWHECDSRPTELLARTRQLLASEPAQRWGQAAMNPEQNSKPAFRLLPLWLLELRALRLQGRNSPEWNEANHLAVQRFGFLACRVDLSSFWSSEPNTVLLTLEAVRQLAVARSDLPGRGAWDREMLRCARQILVRLETIDDARVRRVLSGFVHPVLTAVAAWWTAKGTDPLEGLCLFEMARSRWILDHLALGNRTLVYRPTDNDTSRDLKDSLFALINQQSLWEEVPEEFMERLQRENPDLARLTAASWLHPGRGLEARPA